MQDKSYFYKLLNNICIGTFGTEVVRLPDEDTIEKPPLLLFGDFMAFGAAREQRIYEELTEIPIVKRTLEVPVNYSTTDQCILEVFQNCRIIWKIIASPLEKRCKLYSSWTP